MEKNDMESVQQPACSAVMEEDVQHQSACSPVMVADVYHQYACSADMEGYQQPACSAVMEVDVQHQSACSADMEVDVQHQSACSADMEGYQQPACSAVMEVDVQHQSACSADMEVDVQHQSACSVDMETYQQPACSADMVEVQQQSTEVPILYYDELCPQSRSCYVLVKILEIDVDLKPSSVIKGNKVTESLTKFLPTLVDGQMVLSAPHSILIYLCDKYAGENFKYLLPRDETTRLDVLNMLFLEGSILYSSYNNLMMEILKKKLHKINMNYHRKKVIEAYNILNSKLEGQLYIAGNELTIADIAIVTTLSSLCLVFPFMQADWPNIYEYFKNMKAMKMYGLDEESLHNLDRLLKGHGDFPLKLSLQDEGVYRSRSRLNSSISGNCLCSLKRGFFKLFSSSREVLRNSNSPTRESSKPQNEGFALTEYSSFSKSVAIDGGLIQEATTSKKISCSPSWFITKSMYAAQQQNNTIPDVNSQDSHISTFMETITITTYPSYIPRVIQFKHSKMPSK